MAQYEDEKWEEMYNEHLTDPDMGLTKEQARVVMIEMGQIVTDPDMDKLWEKEKDRTGITLQELKDFNMDLGDPKESLRQALKDVFDADGSGSIDRDELKALLRDVDVRGSEVYGDDVLIDDFFGGQKEIPIDDCVEKIQEYQFLKGPETGYQQHE